MLKDQFGANFKMSDDMQRQMNMDDMMGGLSGKKSPFGNKKKKRDKKFKEQTIDSENIKIDQTSFKMERDDSI